jgi:hypothetical protein
MVQLDAGYHSGTIKSFQEAVASIRLRRHNRKEISMNKKIEKTEKQELTVKVTKRPKIRTDVKAGTASMNLGGIVK